MTLYTCVRILPSASYAGRLSFLTQQCRSFYLMTDVLGKKGPLDGSKIVNIVPFKSFKPLDQCPLDLHYALPEPGRRRTTLLNVMQTNINPGWVLCEKTTSEFNECPQYKLKHISRVALQAMTSGRFGNNSRVFQLSAKMSQHLFVELAALMFKHLSRRQPIEIQVLYHQEDYEYAKETFSDPFEELFAKNLHLRPDVILKAMPEKCGIIIDPQTDNASTVGWVMGPPRIGKNGNISLPENLTKILNVKRNQALKKFKEVKEEKEREMEEARRKIEAAFSAENDPALLEDIQYELGEDSSEKKAALKAALEERRRKREELEEVLKERARARKLRRNMKGGSQQGLTERRR